ncbi:hypothetical protein BLA60_27495 [Actinophytocola xinjiangensis]|uniref:CoA-binding domain-containing protein n=1 Tax=Actinophytocola xinjiangensis TaxID=485602 RepID=A0A7Z0WHF7_9PSEU|nr:acetate--CoA ligase family protein [Actinophytocola xinjiangensis]OLF07320.1 hypothetical protein BLA60_27495 [Actinophytocola xinjiangensis]
MNDSNRSGRDLRPLMRPSSVAVVGASPRGNRGSRVLRNLARFGYQGTVFAVHPRADEVEGVACHPDLASLPDVPELVAVALNEHASVDVLEQAGELGVRAAVLIAAGFEPGAETTARARAVVDRHDMVVCGPNCYGVYDRSTGAAVYSGGLLAPLPAGPVGLILQSGAMSHSVIEPAQGRVLGIESIVTTGSELTVGVADQLAWMVDNPRVGVVGIYLEGLRDPRGFGIAALRAAELDKPVVVLSTGRSPRGRAAARAHTGAVIGDQSALAGYLDSLGVVQVSDVDEFRETLMLLGSGRRATGSAVAAVSISGGASSLFADVAEEVGLALPPLSEPGAAALTERLPLITAPGNPLDMTGMAADDVDLFVDLAATVAAEPGLGGLVLLLNHAARVEGVRLYRAQAGALIDIAASASVPAVAVAVAGGPADPELAEILAAAGIPLLLGLRPAAVALRAWTGVRRRPTTWAPPPARAGGPGVPGDLAGAAALRTLAEAGVPTVEERVVGDPAELAALVRDWGSVVIKADHPRMLHKSDLGAVAVDVTDPEAAVGQARRIAALLPPGDPAGRVIAQRFVSRATAEVLVGVVRDPQVGLTLTVAPGGTLAELFGPARSHPLPVGRAAVERLLDAEPLASLLAGYRGAPPGDRVALVDAVLAFAGLLTRDGAGVAAAEVNPLLVLAAGEGVVAVDARLIADTDSTEGHGDRHLSIRAENQ